ncbi:hypothetical protein GCM10010339_84620 [Streptomyces alanosinicus]|uniref:Transposase n=1 Tax=Streptomyces alanosinicus TaxID=68171 RepID=A0A918YSC5_9ACTN|nr:hypothetical protein GCM10010339_84620 [Streptomyces alanosinicus]
MSRTGATFIRPASGTATPPNGRRMPRAALLSVPGGPGQGRQRAPPDRRGARHPARGITTGGDRKDVTRLIPLIQAVPPIRGKRGRPLRRPKHLYADRGHDHEVYRDKVRRFQITPHLAQRGTGHGSGLGGYRWVVEGTIALPHWFRRLRTALCRE